MRRRRSALLDVAKRLARGDNHVHITLRWNTIDWRASTQCICGHLKNGAPFTICEVARGALILWLSGETLSSAIPTLTREERNILQYGDLTSRNDEEVFRSAVAVHPGEVLKDYLDARQWSVRDLAIRCGVPPAEITAILRGRLAITETTAKKFERILQRPAHLWLNLQKLYDERQGDHP